MSGLLDFLAKLTGRSVGASSDFVFHSVILYPKEDLIAFNFPEGPIRDRFNSGDVDGAVCDLETRLHLNTVRASGYYEGHIQQRIPGFQIDEDNKAEDIDVPLSAFTDTSLDIVTLLGILKHLGYDTLDTKRVYIIYVIGLMVDNVVGYEGKNLKGIGYFYQPSFPLKGMYGHSGVILIAAGDTVYGDSWWFILHEIRHAIAFGCHPRYSEAGDHPPLDLLDDQGRLVNNYSISGNSFGHVVEEGVDGLEPFELDAVIKWASQ